MKVLRKLNESRDLIKGDYVSCGMIGQDYNQTEGIVLKIGHKNEMRKYDRYDVVNYLEDTSEYLVLVQLKNTIELYIYGYDGFYCSENKFNTLISYCDLEMKK